MQQAWDKNGRIYYIDDNGNKVQPKTTKNAFERLGMQAKVGLGNLNRWLQNADTNSQSYKDKVNVALGLLTAPIGGSSVLAAKGAGALTPFVGKKIAQNIASGAVGGATGGAVEGFGRGIVEQKNPIKTAVQDGTIGLVTGALGGAAGGKIGQVLDKRALGNNTLAPEQYFADYVEGLSNNTPINKVSRFQKALGDFKMAREGNSVAGTGTLFDILKDSNGNYLKLLHGTSGKFDNFDKSKLGSLTGAKSAKQGFWFTDGEKTAQSYADYSAENSELNKLLRKQQAMEKMPLVNWDEYDKLTEEIENIALNPQPEPRIIKAHLDMNNPASFDAKGKRFMEIQEDINNFIESNRNADGFIINNLRDAVNPNVIDEAATHYMVREPDQIKIIKDDVTPNLYDKLIDNYNPEIEQTAKEGNIAGGKNKLFDLLSDGMSEAERLEKIEDLQVKGGYSSEKNKSNRALAAELEGKDNISNLAKKLGLPSKEIKDVLYSNEWHHTNKNFTKTKYYATDAYLDLKNNNEISQQTIDKYDLSPFDIRGIKKSWEDLQKKLNAPSAENILSKYREMYKNDENLLKDLDKVLKRKTKNEGLAASEIRMMLQEYQLGNIDEKRLADSIHFYSTEARNLRKSNKH